MDWIYDGKPFTEEMIQPDWVGFVYLIENLKTGRKYVGKKGLFRMKSYQHKGKKRRKTVQSDWKSYYGSSASLKEDIRQHSKENFCRTIIRICKSKSEMNYFELREQMTRDVLLDSLYYNDYVGTRINRNQLRKLIDEINKT